MTSCWRDEERADLNFGYWREWYLNWSFKDAKDHIDWARVADAGREVYMIPKEVASTFQGKRKQELKNKEESFGKKDNPVCLLHIMHDKEIWVDVLTEKAFGLSESLISNLGPCYLID